MRLFLLSPSSHSPSSDCRGVGSASSSLPTFSLLAFLRSKEVLTGARCGGEALKMEGGREVVGGVNGR